MKIGVLFTGLGLLVVVQIWGSTCGCVEIEFMQRFAASEAKDSRFLGAGVSVWGDVLVAGAYGSEKFQGSAYVYRKVDGEWTEEARLVAPDGRPGDAFSFMQPVVLENMVVLNAVKGRTDNGVRSGVVFVFEYQNNEWQMVQSLIPPVPREGDRFGISMSHSDGSLMIASDYAGDFAQGVVYHYQRGDSGLWEAVEEFVGAEEGDQFGEEVLVSGEWMAISAIHGDTDLVKDAGVVSMYQKVDGRWKKDAILNSPDGETGSRFGTGLAMTASGTLVVGASRAQGLSGEATGAVFVFQQSDYGWTLTDKLAANDGQARNEFGSRVTIDPSGSIIAVAASRDSTQANFSGAVYIFARCRDLVWAQVHKLYSPMHPQAGAMFGLVPVLTQDTLFVPSPRESILDQQEGALYAYSIAKPSRNPHCRLVVSDFRISKGIPFTAGFQYALEENYEAILSILHNGHLLHNLRYPVQAGSGFRRVNLSADLLDELERGLFVLRLDIVPVGNETIDSLCRDNTYLLKLTGITW
uniref:Uncharacterized protein n=1 Tax=Rhodosorus marinus TaxID=101924 RepID=A0A7S3ELL2_9RHOD|mmetsp:Transcript_45746/g.178066  ORF Transcript_45746/g.178066 Transcript_45746/m.178066 type:complete len:524 (+) Transcript_45746:270-1841(+)|eukprot:CAMPEP_0113954716 /NCGR_PEP_ID=MMETSP0011_2-20120614/780_1 /TAXON_ID=101924 /ORGANISM="Rhodosorus marinus" /LENGTH=523 /DNA_ID=CAMNT_0000964021 /DNA_START=83 /DNA_END=1654 /DNA_ORIENTATION=- /assembly_acc=CAM_ASM_000156